MKKYPLAESRRRERFYNLTSRRSAEVVAILITDGYPSIIILSPTLVFKAGEFTVARVRGRIGVVCVICLDYYSRDEGTFAVVGASNCRRWRLDGEQLYYALLSRRPLEAHL